jgi:acylphosphatase
VVSTQNGQWRYDSWGGAPRATPDDRREVIMAEETRTSVRRRVLYIGRVQGVCFRASTQDLSRAHDVVGWVRNLADGAVELEAEGAPAEVEAFLDAVARHFRDNIRNEQRMTLPPRGDEVRFEVRY